MKENISIKLKFTGIMIFSKYLMFLLIFLYIKVVNIKFSKIIINLYFNSNECNQKVLNILER
jgi:hypothetical protein